MQELAIGVMPLSSLLLGVAAQAYGVGATTFVSGVILVVVLAGLGITVPQLLRYSGSEPSGTAPAQPVEQAG